MTLTRSQKGMSMLSWMVLLAVVAFLASAVFKMVPHYLDYMSMKKIITSVETDKAADIRNVGDLYSHVSKGRSVNSISELEREKALKVTIDNNEFRAELNSI